MFDGFLTDLRTQRWRIVAHVLLVLVVAGAVTWSVLFPHWLAGDSVPPGDDPVVHLGIIAKILAGKGLFVGLPYPPLFHWITAFVARVFSLDTLPALWLVLTPLIGIIPLATAGLFVYSVSRWKTIPILAGMTATLALFLLSRQPLRAWGDGNYSNMLAEGVLIPLLIFTLIRLNERWTPLRAACVIGALGLIFLTHAMSIVVAIGLFAVAILALNTTRWNKLLLAAPIIVLIAIAWLKVIQPEISLDALGSVLMGNANIIPGLAADTSAATPLSGLSLFFGQPFLGITLTLLLLAVTMYVVEPDYRFTLLCLFAWAAVLFVASRISGFAVPDRFLRDVSYPLIALAATSIALVAKRQPLASVPLILLLAVLAAYFAPYIAGQPGTFAAHPDGIRAILQRTDRASAEAFRSLAPLIPADALLVTNRTSSYVPFLLHHDAVALGEPSVGIQTKPYYILIGPEPGGSLRSQAEATAFATITAYLESLPGAILADHDGVVLKRVTPITY